MSEHFDNLRMDEWRNQSLPRSKERGMTPKQRVQELVTGYDTTLEGRSGLQKAILDHICAAVAAEREACAKIVDDQLAHWRNFGNTVKAMIDAETMAETIRKEIRAREG